MPKPKVIFLCNENSARSQMAEAFLNRLAGDYFDVYSAGFEVSQIHPMTRTVMAEIGYDLEGHHAKPLSQYLGKKHFGILITVCNKAETLCPTMPGLGTRLYWPFDNPSAFQGPEEAQLEVFRKTRDAIKTRIQAWLETRDLPEPDPE